NVQPNQLSQPITAQQPSFSKKKYSFGKIFWIFFIASVLIAFLAGGYFLAGKQSKFIVKNQQQPATPTVAQSTLTPTPDPTANWKTRTGAFYSFKYPADWKEKQAEEGGGFYLVPVNNSNVLFSAHDFTYINLDDTPQKLVNRVLENETPIIVKMISVDGHEGIRLERQSSNGGIRIEVYIGGVKSISNFHPLDGGPTMTSGTELVFMEIKQSTEIDKYRNIFNQIISAFKFTNQNKTINAANGKQYTGKDFTFIYPNNWLTDNKQVYDPSTMFKGGSGGNSILYKSRLWFAEYPSQQSIEQYIVQHYGNQQGFKSNDIAVNNLNGKSFYNPIGEGTFGWYVGFSNGNNVVLFGPAGQDITQDSTLNTIINSFTFIQ
ncbi:MAG: hypothetical protein Q8O88_05045, partial [bacterium]|nr:hypothetical protein [bacterium]